MANFGPVTAEMRRSLAFSYIGSVNAAWYLHATGAAPTPERLNQSRF